MKRAAGAAIKILVSAALLGLLVYFGWKNDVVGNLRKVAPSRVAIATAVLLSGWLLNSVRWGMLLRVVGVREKASSLASLYFIGMFFSQMLPTGAGGDAVRMWDLYRRGHKPAAVVVATLQERLLGMGVSLLAALVVLPFYFHDLPLAARPVLVGLPIAAIVAVGIFLYPRLPMSFLGIKPSNPSSASQSSVLSPQSFLSKAKLHLIRLLRPASELPSLIPSRLLPILLITLLGDLLSIGAWWLLGRAVGLTLPFTAYLLVVPLVWVISMTPSLGGVGVREGGFVWLMLMFAVPKDKSLAVAALYLIIQIILAVVGGVLLMGRVWSGQWKSRGSAMPVATKPHR